MCRILTSIGAVAWLALSGPAMAACQPSQTVDQDPIQFFLGIEPSDNPLDVWCKLQVMNGDYKIDAWFTTVNAHKSFDTKFDGTPSQGKEVMSNFVQSLFPQGLGSKKVDENGQEFPKVLKNAVQAQSPKTEDGQQLGLPPEYELSDSVALWEPMAIRVKPVRAFGAEFVLTVKFKPAAGKFLQVLQDKAEPFPLKVATERVLDGVPKNAKREECPERIPNCGKLTTTETMDMQTAYIVDSVMLESHDGRMSPTTKAFFNGLANRYQGLVTENNMDKFTFTDGSANLTVTSDNREILAIAHGDPNQSLGTRAVRVVWQERNVPTSYRARLAEWTKQVREKLVVMFSKSADDQAPK